MANYWFENVLLLLKIKPKGHVILDFPPFLIDEGLSAYRLDTYNLNRKDHLISCCEVKMFFFLVSFFEQSKCIFIMMHLFLFHPAISH